MNAYLRPGMIFSGREPFLQNAHQEMILFTFPEMKMDPFLNEIGMSLYGERQEMKVPE